MIIHRDLTTPPPRHAHQEFAREFTRIIREHAISKEWERAILSAGVDLTILTGTPMAAVVLFDFIEFNIKRFHENPAFWIAGCKTTILEYAAEWEAVK